MKTALALLAMAAQNADLKEALRFEQKVRKVCETVRKAYVFFGNGSGICISADGWVLTNYHVAGDRDGQKVRMTGGKVFTADVVGWDLHGDVALCRLQKAKDLPFCELGDSDALRIGQRVIAMGNPFLLGNGSWEPSITFGIVSALHRYMDNPGYFDAIQTDAQINPGNSGGPLMTLEGKVVGINGRIDIKRFMSRVNTGIGYAIPSNQIKRYMKAMRQGGRVYEGSISGLTITECGDDRYENSGEYGDGSLVVGVEEETPAAAAGFEPGDVVFQIEGHRILNNNRFFGVVSNWPEGETIRVKVRREGKERELKVFLGEPHRVREREMSFWPVSLGFVPWTNPEGTRYEVRKIAPDGPAAKAGLKEGDMLVAIGGAKLESWDDFRAAVLASSFSKALRLTVVREGKKVELELVPVKR